MPAKSKKNKKEGNLADQIESQLAVSNPISQYKILSENIDTLKGNLEEIVALTNPIYQRLKPSEAPCEIAKYVAEKVCTLDLENNKLTDLLSISKIKELVSQSYKNIELLKKDFDENGLNIDYSKHASNLADTSSSAGELIKDKTVETSKFVNKQIEKTSKSIEQQGGGNNVYNYIINPRTGRKVNVKSKLGKKIILSYINNL